MKRIVLAAAVFIALSGCVFLPAKAEEVVPQETEGAGEENPEIAGSAESRGFMEGLEREQNSGAAGSTVGQNPETTEPVHQPRLLVTSALAERSLKAGNTERWKVTVKNCSAADAVENMKVTLAAEGQDIVLEKTSWYFTKVEAGKTVDLSQNITVGKKAQEEPVLLSFQFEYEDKQGGGYTCTESVRLPVSQEQRAEFANLSFPESAYVSDTEPLTFQVYNTGLATLYNVRVRLAGKGLFPTRDLFLGNMEAGASKDGEIPVFIGTLDMDEGGEASGEGEKYGETAATVVFSYENEQGEVKEQTVEIHTEIKEPQQVQLKIEEEVPQTNQWWISSIVLAALVLFSVIVWLYLRMKHFKKQVELYEKAQSV